MLLNIASVSWKCNIGCSLTLKKSLIRSIFHEFLNITIWSRHVQNPNNTQLATNHRGNSMNGRFPRLKTLIQTCSKANLRTAILLIVFHKHTKFPFIRFTYKLGQ